MNSEKYKYIVQLTTTMFFPNNNVMLVTIVQILNSKNWKLEKGKSVKTTKFICYSIEGKSAIVYLAREKRPSLKL